MTEQSDDNLIKSFLAGNAEAFNLLYERYRKPLFAYLNRLLLNRAEVADDVFQQTWLKAIRQMDKYENREKFLAWLMRIAHNVTMDHFRKTARLSENTFDDVLSDTLSAAESSCPWHGMQTRELAEALESSVKELSPELREVFLLRQEDVAFKDIAVIQGCPIGTVLARMRYALKNLRKSLTQRQIKW